MRNCSRTYKQEIPQAIKIYCILMAARINLAQGWKIGILLMIPVWEIKPGKKISNNEANGI